MHLSAAKLETCGVGPDVWYKDTKKQFPQMYKLRCREGHAKTFPKGVQLNLHLAMQDV